MRIGALMPASDKEPVVSLATMIQRTVAARNPAVLLEAAWSARDALAARFYLRQCTRVGAFTRLSGHPPHIHNLGTLMIGERVRLLSTILPIELVAMPGGTLVIGDRTCLNYGVSIAAHQSITIGRRCLIGPYVNIQDNDWHDVVDRSRKPPSRPVIIEDNVWLGTRAIVLPGVTVGHDAVIAAGAVVLTDIPPRSVAMGNPARVIRSF
jgi:maltose O-acetyltransferase